MKKWNVAAIRAAKGKTKLGCVTAYDACFARLADEAGVPIVLVGDSQGMNCLGYETTLPVNMSDTLAAVAAVARGAKDFAAKVKGKKDLVFAVRHLAQTRMVKIHVEPEDETAKDKEKGK